MDDGAPPLTPKVDEPAHQGRNDPRADVREIDDAIALIRQVLEGQMRTLQTLERIRRRLSGSGDRPCMPAETTQKTESPTVVEQRVQRLTNQERKVLLLIGQGWSNRHIARGLGISEKTVKNYVHAIFRKMAVSSRTEAAVVALRHGWITPREGEP